MYTVNSEVTETRSALNGILITEYILIEHSADRAGLIILADTG